MNDYQGDRLPKFLEGKAIHDLVYMKEEEKRSMCIIDERERPIDTSSERKVAQNVVNIAKIQMAYVHINKVTTVQR